MGIASHLGPWLLGTQKYNNAPVSTANAALGQNRNMGVTTVGQTATVNYNDAANSIAFIIPAGSILTNIAFYTAGITGTSPTLTVYVNSTAVTGAQALTSGTAFASSISFAAAAATTIANVGTTDVAIKYTVGGSSLTTGSGTLLVEYMVRNSDGTYIPASSNA